MQFPIGGDLLNPMEGYLPKLRKCTFHPCGFGNSGIKGIVPSTTMDYISCQRFVMRWRHCQVGLGSTRNRNSGTGCHTSRDVTAGGRLVQGVELVGCAQGGVRWCRQQQHSVPAAPQCDRESVKEQNRQAMPLCAAVRADPR